MSRSILSPAKGEGRFWKFASPAVAAASPTCLAPLAMAGLDPFRQVSSADPDKELILSDSSLLFALSLPEDSPSLLEGREMNVAAGLPMIEED